MHLLLFPGMQIADYASQTRKCSPCGDKVVGVISLLASRDAVGRGGAQGERLHSPVVLHPDATVYGKSMCGLSGRIQDEKTEKSTGNQL